MAKNSKISKLVKKDHKALMKLTRQMKADTNIFTQSNASTIPQGGLMYNIFTPAEGVAVQTRSDRTAVVNKLNVIAEFVRGTADSFVDMIVFRLTQSGGFLPLQSELIESAGTAISQMSPLRWDNRHNIHVIKRKRIILDSYHPNHIVNVSKSFKKPFVTTFLDDTNGVSSYGSNQYYVYFCSDLAANEPSMTYYASSYFQI